MTANNQPSNGDKNTELAKEKFVMLATAVQRAIKEHGYFRQGINNGISYTVGLAIEKGYEIIVLPMFKDDISFGAYILSSESKGKYPFDHVVYTSGVFSVRVNGKPQPARYGFIEITDLALISELTIKACYGWQTFQINTATGKSNMRSLIKKVYLGVMSDANNILPWEEGYNFGDQSVKALQKYLETQEALFL